MAEVRTTDSAGARVPKQRRSLETQEKILTAALTVFAERGYDGASVRLVAERAGVGHPVVVYHFPTKEDLWVVTAEAALAKFMDRLLPNLQALEGLDPAIRLSLIFQDFTRFSAENPELLPIMIDANHVIVSSENSTVKFDPRIMERIQTIRDSRLAGNDTQDSEYLDDSSSESESDNDAVDFVLHNAFCIQK